MNISSHLINIEYDNDDQMLFSRNSDRRVAISSCRDSLNGYQKGRCFYCFPPSACKLAMTLSLMLIILFRGKRGDM